ncbi:hypothetical protein Hypma_010929 [Hypsizygus marmoreus]|uniref:Uncharacterized protein n=1 Tax=Hypsizygus marmoreus TaxID=39966 RepID=A0A369JKL8_HYPMA|nr:hypothetical protein Hypma_010929 [Hypsizygus marmoreus]
MTGTDTRRSMEWTLSRFGFLGNPVAGHRRMYSTLQYLSGGTRNKPDLSTPTPTPTHRRFGDRASGAFVPTLECVSEEVSGRRGEDER